MENQDRTVIDCRPKRRSAGSGKSHPLFGVHLYENHHRMYFEKYMGYGPGESPDRTADIQSILLALDTLNEAVKANFPGFGIKPGPEIHLPKDWKVPGQTQSEKKAKAKA